MKNLQNNFTAPEQSKRLLELGVPADSADCIWWSDDDFTSGYLSIIPYNKIFSNDRRLDKNEEVDNWKKLPCWSVGRLIEIIGICAGMEYIDFETLVYMKLELSEKLIIMINDFVLYNKIDFSKLEE